MDKYCPILLGARGIPPPSFWDGDGCAGGILEARKQAYKEAVGCKEERCEWYEHGCPAHPVTKEGKE